MIQRRATRRIHLMRFSTCDRMFWAADATDRALAHACDASRYSPAGRVRPACVERRRRSAEAAGPTTRLPQQDMPIRPRARPADGPPAAPEPWLEILKESQRWVEIRHHQLEGDPANKSMRKVDQFVRKHR